VLRREEDDALRKVLSFKTEGQMKRGRPRNTWWRQIQLEIGLRKRCALNRARRRYGRSQFMEERRQIRSSPFNANKIGFKLEYYYCKRCADVRYHLNKDHKTS